MIKIIDDWYVTVETNPTNYVVRRGDYKKDAKGSIRDKALSYHTSLRGAVRFIRWQIVAEELQGDFPTLRDALAAVSGVDDRFEKIISEVKA